MLEESGAGYGQRGDNEEGEYRSGRLPDRMERGRKKHVSGIGMA